MYIPYAYVCVRVRINNNLNVFSLFFMCVQEKQSPVSELLKKADHLIATKNTQPEVYEAMADSLGLAWKDVNDILQKRSYLLLLNVEYHK